MIDECYSYIISLNLGGMLGECGYDSPNGTHECMICEYLFWFWVLWRNVLIVFQGYPTQSLYMWVLGVCLFIYFYRNIYSFETPINLFITRYDSILDLPKTTIFSAFSR